MQSGLRNCPKDVSLWLEYFRMELLYANKLILRRTALGIHNLEAPEVQDDAATSSSAADALILAGGLARLVYAQAVKAAPSNAGLRRQFLEVAAAVPCTATPQLMEHIADSMSSDFTTVSFL